MKLSELLQWQKKELDTTRMCEYCKKRHPLKKARCCIKCAIIIHNKINQEQDEKERMVRVKE
jgi:hypothetical protein